MLYPELEGILQGCVILNSAPVLWLEEAVAYSKQFDLPDLTEDMQIFGKKFKRVQMTMNRKTDMHEAILKAHREGIEQAIDLSIRTGVPLVIEENGVIKEIKPKFKYVKVPVDFNDDVGVKG